MIILTGPTASCFQRRCAQHYRMLSVFLPRARALLVEARWHCPSLIRQWGWLHWLPFGHSTPLLRKRLAAHRFSVPHYSRKNSWRHHPPLRFSNVFHSLSVIVMRGPLRPLAGALDRGHRHRGARECEAGAVWFGRECSVKVRLEYTHYSGQEIEDIAYFLRG